MNKKVYNKVLERSEGLCEVTGCNRMVQLHHIFFGNGKRVLCESVEACIMLCWDMHEGTKGVHGRDGHELDLKLKRMAQQRYFDEGYSEDEVRKITGGRIY